MPKVLAQSNLPNNAAVVVSSETIILRDPNNSILEKYTSDEQKQASLKSYGVKPATLLSPGDNETEPINKNYKFYNWLRTDGKAFLDSKIIPKSSYKFEISFKYIAGNSAIAFGVLGPLAAPDTSNARLLVIFDKNSENVVDWRVFCSKNTSSNAKRYLDEVSKVNLTIKEGKVFTSGGEEIDIPSYSNALVFSQSFYIFAERRNDIPINNGIMSLYYMKIWDENDNIIFDIVPASRKGIPGAYDKANDVFLSNANSEGAFSVGNGSDEITGLSGFNLNPNALNGSYDEEMI